MAAGGTTTSSRFRTPSDLDARISEAHGQLQAWLREVDTHVPEERMKHETFYHRLKPYCENAAAFRRWALSLGNVLQDYCIDMPELQVAAAMRNPIVTLVSRPGLACARGYAEEPAQAGRNGRAIKASVPRYGDALTRLEYALADTLTLCVVLHASCRCTNLLDRYVCTIPVWSVKGSVMDLPRPLFYAGLPYVSLCVEAETCTAQAEQLADAKVLQHVLAFDVEPRRLLKESMPGEDIIPPLQA